MRSLPKILVPAFGAILVTACGSNLEPMTEAQKAEFKKTLREMGSPVAQTRQSSLKTSKTASFKSVQASSDDYFTPAELESLESACDLDFKQSEVGQVRSVEDLLNREFSAEGKIVDKDAACPVALSFSAKARVMSDMKSSIDGSMSFNVSYLVKSSELAARVDITKFDVKGSGSIQGDDKSGEITFKADGEVTSKKNGTLSTYIDVEASGSENGADGTAKFGIKYPTYTAELKVTSDGKNAAKFWLNDEEITQQQAEAFLKDSLGGVSGKTAESSAGSGPDFGSDFGEDSDEIDNPFNAYTVGKRLLSVYGQ